MHYTFVDDAVPTSSQWNGMLRDQVVEQCTSGTRPTGVEGQLIYETDTDRVLYYNGSAWVSGGWRTGTYTPTLVGMAIGTGGSAANDAEYRFGFGSLLVWGAITFGTSGTTFPSTTSTISLPAGFTAVSASVVTPVGRVIWGDNGTAEYEGPARLASTSTLRLYVSNASGTYVSLSTPSSTVPHTWAAGDYVVWFAAVPGIF